MDEHVDPAVGSLLAMVRALQHESPARSIGVEAKLDKLLGVMSRFPDHFVYVYNISEGRIVYHSGLCEVLGYSTEDLTVETLYGLIHPDDAPIVAQLNEALIRALIGIKVPEDISEVALTMDYRMRRQNGSYIRVLRQSIVLEVDGLSRGAISTASLCKDISTIKSSTSIGWQIRAPLAGLVDMSTLAEYAGRMHYRPSPREMDVVRELAKGKTSKEIARALRISLHTVNAHRRNLLERTGLSNTTELVHRMVGLGWI